jgi:hypothetical protein
VNKVPRKDITVSSKKKSKSHKFIWSKLIVELFLQMEAKQAFPIGQEKDHPSTNHVTWMSVTNKIY